MLLSFVAAFVPDNVKLGCVCYCMRDFVPHPLQCFRCQAYGHVAAVCRREIPRCEKCAGGHVIKVCVVYCRCKTLCVNCRDVQGTGDQRCPVKERQVEVARIRAVQKVSYAEAEKRQVDEDGSRVRHPNRIPVSRPRSI